MAICWSILIMSYFVVHRHWINSWKFSAEKYICHSIFRCLSICFSSGVAIEVHSMAHASFSTFSSFSVSLALTLFGNLIVWLTWMVPFQFKDYEAKSSSLNSFYVWNMYLNSVIKWQWLSTMHVFSQDN